MMETSGGMVRRTVTSSILLQRNETICPDITYAEVSQVTVIYRHGQTQTHTDEQTQTYIYTPKKYYVRREKEVSHMVSLSWKREKKTAKIILSFTKINHRQPSENENHIKS